MPRRRPSLLVEGEDVLVLEAEAALGTLPGGDYLTGLIAEDIEVADALKVEPVHLPLYGEWIAGGHSLRLALLKCGDEVFLLRRERVPHTYSPNTRGFQCFGWRKK